AIRVHHLPAVAAIVGAEQLTALGLLAFPRQAITGLDRGVDAVRIRLRDRRHDLADRFGRQAVAGELLPGRAAVARHEQAAAGSAALAAPGVDLQLPHAGEENPRIARIHRQLGAAGVLVDEQRALPRRAAVGGAEDAALGLRPIGVAQRAREHHLRVRRIDDDATDAPGLVEPHVLPRLPGLGRLVDAVADRDVAADPCLAGPGPDDVGIGRRDREGANRLHRLRVEYVLPVHAAVGGFGDAS